MTLAAYGALAVATCLLAPLVGSTPISLARVFDRSIPFADNVDAQIFFVARMPRVLAGALVGAALASAGVVLQALLRNPLATPFTLGVSAGAALGAILAISFGARCHARPAVAGAARQPRRRVRRRRDRLCAGDEARAGDVDVGAAARGRDAELVLLGADPVRPVHGGLHRGLPHAALDDGRPRRRQLRSDRRRPAARRDGLPDLRGAALVAEPAERRQRHRRHPRRRRRRGRSGWRSSARRWRRARPSRWPARSASSASSCRTWCG